MTDTQTANTPAAAVRRTHGKPNDNAAPAGVNLDICLGDRGPATCTRCGRHLAPIPAANPRFECEDTHGGIWCAFCLDKTARGIRTAVLLLNTILELREAGQHDQALDALRTAVNGVELLDEATPRPAYQRPARQQPVRHNRRGRKR